MARQLFLATMRAVLAHILVPFDRCVRKAARTSEHCPPISASTFQKRRALREVLAIRAMLCETQGVLPPRICSCPTGCDFELDSSQADNIYRTVQLAEMAAVSTI